MTLQQFLQNFYCELNIVPNQNNGTLVITTKAVRRRDSKAVDGITATINIQQTTDWLMDSQSTLNEPWDWNKVIEETQRTQLDYMAQRAPIDNYFPLNKVDNPDITPMYR